MTTPGLYAEAHGVAVPGAGPLTCRWPAGRAPMAVVLFCHGLGASERDYAGLSAAWAAQGYFVVHPRFPDWIGAVAAAEPGLGLDPGADRPDWAAIPAVRARMHEILHAPEAWLERLRIAGAVMDALDEVAAATCGRLAGPLPGAVAGHSFGAYTAQLLAGAEIDLPGAPGRRFRDGRFRACVLLSPQGRDQQGLRDGSWDGMTGPALVVTGTLDQGAKGQDWRWKSEPFLLAPPGDKYLFVLDGAGHSLGGLTRGSRDGRDAADHDAVVQVTAAFLDAYVTGDPAARARLAAVTDRIGPAKVMFERRG